MGATSDKLFKLRGTLYSAVGDFTDNPKMDEFIINDMTGNYQLCVDLAVSVNALAESTAKLSPMNVSTPLAEIKPEMMKLVDLLKQEPIIIAGNEASLVTAELHNTVLRHFLMLNTQELQTTLQDIQSGFVSGRALRTAESYLAKSQDASFIPEFHQAQNDLFALGSEAAILARIEKSEKAIQAARADMDNMKQKEASVVTVPIISAVAKAIPVATVVNANTIDSANNNQATLVDVQPMSVSELKEKSANIQTQIEQLSMEMEDLSMQSGSTHSNEQTQQLTTDLNQQIEKHQAISAEIPVVQKELTALQEQSHTLHKAIHENHKQIQGITAKNESLDSLQANIVESFSQGNIEEDDMIAQCQEIAHERTDNLHIISNLKDSQHELQRLVTPIDEQKTQKTEQLSDLNQRATVAQEQVQQTQTELNISTRIDQIKEEISVLKTEKEGIDKIITPKEPEITARKVEEEQESSIIHIDPRQTERFDSTDIPVVEAQRTLSSIQEDASNISPEEKKELITFLTREQKRMQEGAKNAYLNYKDGNKKMTAVNNLITNLTNNTMTNRSVIKQTVSDVLSSQRDGTVKTAKASQSIKNLTEAKKSGDYKTLNTLMDNVLNNPPKAHSKSSETSKIIKNPTEQKSSSTNQTYH